MYSFSFSGFRDFYTLSESKKRTQITQLPVSKKPKKHNLKKSKPKKRHVTDSESNEITKRTRLSHVTSISATVGQNVRITRSITKMLESFEYSGVSRPPE